jgi:hypothetical protein
MFSVTCAFVERSVEFIKIKMFTIVIFRLVDEGSRDGWGSAIFIFNYLFPFLTRLFEVLLLIEIWWIRKLSN